MYMAQAQQQQQQGAGAGYYRSRFGDTTLTKVFVGGLAWETPTEELRRYFEQFGEILEAVIICDKTTGRSKGYGFVTFRDPESARQSVENPNPTIDGRRANCNIAALGRPRPSPPRGRSQVRPMYEGPAQSGGPHYGRGPAQMLPPPPPVIYPPYGYMPYNTADYGGYHQAIYNPQIPHQYYHHIYGPGSSPTISPQSPYPYSSFGYPMQPTRPFQAQRLPYMGQYSTAHVEGSFPVATLPHGFQLLPPPHVREQNQSNASDSQNPQQSSREEANVETSNS